MSVLTVPHTSTPATTFITLDDRTDTSDMSLPSLQSLDLLPTRILLPQLLPPKILAQRETGAMATFALRHSYHRRIASTDSNSSHTSDASSLDSFSTHSDASSISTLTSFASPIAPAANLSRSPSPLASPTMSRNAPLISSASDSINGVPWAASESASDSEDGDAKDEIPPRAAAVLLTGAAVSKHLRALERERARGRAHPYRIVAFNRRGSMCVSGMDGDDLPQVSLRRHRTLSEEAR